MSTKIKFQSVRGMRDLVAQDADYFEYVSDVIRQQLSSYGYQAFHPPILESTGLFSRSIGEGTDVVEKEMFTFDDHGESLTMRPEATAGMVRAVIQNGMTFGSHKLWTSGPMFRRERPQKGRYRQFYQFSVEAFGIAEPEQDAEQILLMAEVWKILGIDQVVALKINTLATPSVRQVYRQALVDYLMQHQDQLDTDSHRRLTKNPLRILDSKNPAMQTLITNAPKLADYLDDMSTSHFERVLACLDAAGVEYTIDSTLVRGLDYYNHTVYEWVTDKLGSQGTICGGGRYDGLTEHIGGKPTPAVGFGIGVDRTVLLMQEMGVELPCLPALAYCILLGETATQYGMTLASSLREYYPNRVILTHLANSGMKAQIKKADQSGAEYAIIIGDNELVEKKAVVKKLSTGEQESVAFKDLIGYFNQH